MTATTTRTNLDAALEYSRRGWPVIPLCWPDEEGQCACGKSHTGHDIGKAPLLGAGYQAMRPTEQVVERWWGMWPEANVGVLLEPSGLLFLGPDSDKAEAEADNLGIPPTMVRHSNNPAYVFLRPVDCPISQAIKTGQSKELDIKTVGYFVAHGRHATGCGVYTNGCEPAEAPAWAVGLLKPSTGAQATTLPADLPEVDIATLRVPDRIKQLIQEGHDPERYPSRSEALFAALEALVGAGCDDATMAAVVLSNPIGEKAQEQGERWLAGEIARARAKGEVNPVLVISPRRLTLPEPPWPQAPDESAYYGLAGEIVHAIEPHTEADPLAILVQLLVSFGNVAGRNPFYRVEADMHRMNLNACLVGETSKARKGTSAGHVLRLFEAVDRHWADSRVLSGLSSGEGLIWSVRDPIVQKQPVKEKGKVTGYQEVEIDAGVNDKRLLVLEAEFAQAIKTASRDGNTLSPTIRQAWDTGSLRTMVKNSPAKATDAHISIIGHITRDELLRYLETTEAANGFANRFLWLAVRRSKCLPDGGELWKVNLETFAKRLSGAVTFAQSVGELKRDEEAKAAWYAVYPELSEGQPGLLGAVTSRAEAQVLRLSCLYALLDCSKQVRRDHLVAALALWEYCEDSARWIFGEALGGPMTGQILAALREADGGLTRTQIRDLFGRNKPAEEIDRKLGELEASGLACREAQSTGGRPVERWFAV